MVVSFRYAVRLKVTPTEAERTTYYPTYEDSEEDGTRRLPDFLEARKHEFGDRVRWAALQQTDGDRPYNDLHPQDWKEVTRLMA